MGMCLGGAATRWSLATRGAIVSVSPVTPCSSLDFCTCFMILSRNVGWPSLLTASQPPHMALSQSSQLRCSLGKGNPFRCHLVDSNTVVLCCLCGNTPRRPFGVCLGTHNSVLLTWPNANETGCPSVARPSKARPSAARHSQRHDTCEECFNLDDEDYYEPLTTDQPPFYNNVQQSAFASVGWPCRSP
eukprot:SAG31_NODE_9858_length_1219_cov_17.197321_1_plen_188_part_00